MVKGSVKTSSRPSAEAKKVGPPLLILALGYASVLVSVPLIFIGGIPAHVLGYVAGSLIPILIIGFVRRIDLSRRRSSYYEANRFLGPALAVLAILAIVTAAAHVWPIATELSS